MAYMIYQQVTTAVLRGYADRSDAAVQYLAAERYREWVEGLHVDQALRETLTEPIRALEDAFASLARAEESGGRN